MNFKRYHVSRNLFIQKLTGVTIDSLGGVVSDANYDTYIAEVSDGETYTVCNVTGTQVFGFFTTKPTLGSITYNSSRTVFSTSSQTLTVPTGENIKYIGVRYNTGVSDAMLNTGSTPLPYEPYSSEVWHDTPHYIHNTATDTITTLPAIIYPNDTTATVGLKGNMEQNGTPSPTTLIQPSECGERTGNLFFKKLSNTNIGSAGTIVGNQPDFDLYIASVIEGELYTISDGFAQVYAYYTTEPTIGSTSYNNARTVVSEGGITSITIPAGDDIHYIAARFLSSNRSAMLNTGSTPLPYEPYGYKIPISSGGTTTNVYLGEVESTRQIKKYEFTGEESWASFEQSGVSLYRCVNNLPSKISGSPIDTMLCNVLRIVRSRGECTTTSNSMAVYNVQNDSRPVVNVNPMTLSEWTTYIQQQYAAGTPVCVWYVLATPETAVVNEPIRKIGDYADEVSGITIPTISGANSFDVLTTLKPSEVTVNYKGWHPVADVHERENGAWT